MPGATWTGPRANSALQQCMACDMSTEHCSPCDEIVWRLQRVFMTDTTCEIVRRSLCHVATLRERLFTAVRSMGYKG